MTSKFSNTPDSDAPRAGPSLVEASDLHFQYWLDLVPVQALRGISVSIRTGEQAVLCGPSGSGKSTLLALLGLIESPQKGQLSFRGEAVSALSERERNRIRRFEIGFVFQSFHLFPTLTAAENVEYFLIQQGLDASVRRERVRQSLEAVGLWERKDHRPLDLSGGQRQRVAIARAAAKHPQLILADEPTASLDQKTGSEIMSVLDALRRELGTAVVIASHDPMVIGRAERLIRLQDGKEATA
jgi:putative ABC transport system ATP-binding protein